MSGSNWQNATVAELLLAGLAAKPLPRSPHLCEAAGMPTPKVATVDAFFAKLGETERPHLEALRALSLIEARNAGLVESLKWNWPAYTSPSGRTVWMLQCFKNHCSLRFPVRFFADHRAEVEAAGYEAIEGALKLTWGQELPKTLITKLLRARVRDFEAGNTA